MTVAENNVGTLVIMIKGITKQLAVLLLCVYTHSICFGKDHESIQIEAGEWSEQEWADSEWDDDVISTWDKSGFIEVTYGRFTQSNLVANSDSIKEARAQLALSGFSHNVFTSVKLDLISDEIDDDTDLDVRELYLDFSPKADIDIRAGRQTLTWGTGDQIFLNDVFAKDAYSLYFGRDIGYLKVPADAVRINLFTKHINADIVWIPQFTPDKRIDGRRLSVFSKADNSLVGKDFDIKVNEVNHDELAVRIYRNSGSSEIAGYLYKGYYKRLLGIDPDTMKATYPRLAAIGASFRTNILNGIGNIESSWYYSLDDKHGDNAYITNSQLRFLVGFVKEVKPKLELGLQYYLELIQNYDHLLANSQFPDLEAKEKRHTVTSRITYRAFLDKLTMNCFFQYSTNEKDYYISPRVNYRPNDSITYELTANYFGGKYIHTALGQLDKNDNISFRIRYSF